MTGHTINKSLVTIVSIWDSYIFAGNLYCLDAYSSCDHSIPAEYGSLFKQTLSPVQWWDQESVPKRRIFNCKYPERVSDSKDYNQSWLKPVHVLEIYGVDDVLISHSQVAFQLSGGFYAMHDAPEGAVKGVWGDGIRDRTVLNVELPIEKITATLDEYVAHHLPKGLANFVIKDYKQVGQYAHLSGC